MRRQLLQLVLLVVLVGLWPPELVCAECPESGFWCDNDSGFNSADPVFSVSCQTDWAPGSATIDSIHGMVRTSCSNYLAFQFGMADQFQFTPPLADRYLTVRLRWKGTVRGGASGWFVFNTTDGRWWTPDAETSEPVAFADSVDVRVMRFDDDTLYFAFGADGSGSRFDGEIQFGFVDLAPGTMVRSCKGYQQEQPTPALARSWGSLKAAYR